jgi:uncharacterized protein
MTLQLNVLSGRYAVSQLPANSPIPSWVPSTGFSSVSRTADELSIVCDQSVVPAGIKHQGDWACLSLVGPFEFTLVGILTAVLIPLRDAGVGIFALSTFDTDYVMVAAPKIDTALAALRAAGHTVTGD